jgi:hypothetical protein
MSIKICQSFEKVVDIYMGLIDLGIVRHQLRPQAPPVSRLNPRDFVGFHVSSPRVLHANACSKSKRLGTRLVRHLVVFIFLLPYLCLVSEISYKSMTSCARYNTETLKYLTVYSAEIDQ